MGTFVTFAYRGKKVKANISWKQLEPIERGILFNRPQKPRELMVGSRKFYDLPIPYDYPEVFKHHNKFWHHIKGPIFGLTFCQPNLYNGKRYLACTTHVFFQVVENYFIDQSRPGEGILKMKKNDEFLKVVFGYTLSDFL